MASLASPRKGRLPSPRGPPRKTARVSAVPFPTPSQVQVPLYKVTRVEPQIQVHQRPSLQVWKRTIIEAFHKKRLLLHRSEVQASILEFLAVNQPIPRELSTPYIRIIVKGLVAMCGGTKVTAPHAFMLLSSLFEQDDRVSSVLVSLVTSGKMDLAAARLPYFVQYVGDNRVQACAIRFAELLMGYGVVGTDIVASLEELYEAERDNDDNVSLSSYTSLDRLDERVPIMALKTPLACSSKGEIGCIMEGEIALDDDYPAGKYKLRVQTFATARPSGAVVKVWYTGQGDVGVLDDDDSDSDSANGVLTKSLQQLTSKRKKSKPLEGLLPASKYRYIQHTEIAFVLRQDMARVNFTILSNGASHVCVTALDVQRTGDLAPANEWLDSLRDDMAQVGTRPEISELARMHAAESHVPGRPPSTSRESTPTLSGTVQSARAPAAGPISPRSAKNFDAGVVPSVGKEDKSHVPIPSNQNDATRILTDEELQRKLAVQELLRWARQERESKLGRQFDADDVTESWKTVLAMMRAGDVASLGVQEIARVASVALQRPLFKLEQRQLQEAFSGRVYQGFADTRFPAQECVAEVVDGVLNACDEHVDSDTESEDEESFLARMTHRVVLGARVRGKEWEREKMNSHTSRGVSGYQPTSRQDPHRPQMRSQVIPDRLQSSR